MARKGPETVCIQQWKFLRLNRTLRPNPCKQFIRDLSSQVEIDYNNKTQICILWDLNEVLGEDPTLTSSLCVKYKLHDAFAHRYQQIPDFTTYIRGTERLEYANIQWNRTNHSWIQPILQNR